MRTDSENAQDRTLMVLSEVRQDILWTLTESSQTLTQAFVELRRNGEWLSFLTSQDRELRRLLLLDGECNHFPAFCGRNPFHLLFELIGNVVLNELCHGIPPVRNSFVLPCCFVPHAQQIGLEVADLLEA